MGEGGTVRTIVKLLSPRSSEKEKEEAISLLYELSKSQNLSEKIGSINGAIIFLVGMTGSNSENVLTVEKVNKTLDNLAQSESNVRLMAENGRLQPLLTLLLEGIHSFTLVFDYKNFSVRYGNFRILGYRDIVLLLYMSTRILGYRDIGKCVQYDFVWINSIR